ncbi:MAG: cysteine desulfurase family protein [Peptoniphilaceae bacterium]|nr:cysteine desulfurase family protein [Peptoniphilaceae bacterium]
MIYFDNAATTPVLPEVRRVIDETLETLWGNPSSLHRKGFEAEKILRKARETVAGILRVDPKSVIFTSGATESINTVLRGVAARHLMTRNGAPANVVISSVEHAAVEQTARALKDFGIDVRRASVDEAGRVDAADMAALVDAHTLLVGMMHVNNELGTIYPIADIVRAVKARKADVPVLVDGTQALGKLVVHPGELGCDYYVSSGHKIHAPKGIGLLYVRPGAFFRPLLTGGPQENGHRAGTENVPYIAGFAAALEAMEASREGDWNPTIVAINRSVRERLAASDARILSPEEASPYILTAAFSGIKAEVLLHFMEREEMYLSSGSACSKGAPSRVLQAIRVPDAYADGAVRLSFGRENTLNEVDPFLDQLLAAVRQIQSLTGGHKA